MTIQGTMTRARYAPPPASEVGPMYLVANAGTDHEQRYVLYERLEIGRDDPRRDPVPGVLLISDPTVSWRHCIVSRSADGRCWVRDVSRNGTRLGGRRLVPNVETELHVGGTLGLGQGHELRLDGDPQAHPVTHQMPSEGTVGMPHTSLATVLVGDIRDYTVLVRRADPGALQSSVSRLFEALNEEVERHGGTVKEYQGDAVFAFWEWRAGPQAAADACRAALALDARAAELARDRSVWTVDGFPLRMEWGLASGPVVLDTFGGARPTGLSMIGEAVVLAFRLEKLAGANTGSILACPGTRQAALRHFEFADLGEMQAKGFDAPDHVFALIGETRVDETQTLISVPEDGP